MLSRFAKNVISDSPWFEISRGVVPGFTPISVFGENDNVGSALETIWEEGGIYQEIPSPTKLKISSNHANDTIAGTGGQKVFVAGLDLNYDWQHELVDMNGLTEVETVNEYIAINILLLFQVGSTDHTEGDIYAGTGIVTVGKPAVVYSKMNGSTGDFDNIALQTHFTIPDGYRGIVKGLLVNTGKGKEGKAQLYVKPFGRPGFVVGKTFNFETSLFIPFEVTPIIPPKGVIEVRAREVVTSSGIEVVAGYNLVLERITRTKQFIMPGTFTNSVSWN